MFATNLICVISFHAQLDAQFPLHNEQRTTNNEQRTTFTSQLTYQMTISNLETQIQQFFSRSSYRAFH